LGDKDLKASLEREDIDAIVRQVIEQLQPLMSGKGKGDAEDTLMTIEEAARFLNTSKGQIYQWVSNAQHGSSDFPYLKAGKLLRFSRKALLKWLQCR
jgi:excisionase family DNA binding protein